MKKLVSAYRRVSSSVSRVRDRIDLFRHDRKLRHLASGHQHEYAEYLHGQFRRSAHKRHSELQDRTKYVGRRLAEYVRPSDEQSVLCIGCRNSHELEHLRALGYGRVVGVDLYSESEDIKVMDMHDLDFPAESFDVIYSSHSFEHAIDPSRAAAEMLRVLRPGGAVCVEVPVRYDTCTIDIQDFQDSAGLLRVFGASVDRVLFQEDSPPNTARNSAPEHVARVIFQTPNSQIHI